MSHTFIIAEAAATHDGDLIHALELINIAKEYGADCIKFQWTSNRQQMAERRHVEDASAYRLLAFPVEWLPVLSKTAHDAGLEFMCTVFLPEDIPIIAPFVDRFKVASLESLDEKFMRAHYEYKKEIIVSAGACAAEDVTDIEGVWPYCDNKQVRWIQCTSAYPCPSNELNLSVISEGDLEGLSDHSSLLVTGAFAVCAGATIIEKHFRHRQTLESNPDYHHSLPPEGLGEYIRYIRLAETMLGDGQKRVTPSEEDLIKHRVRP